MKYHTYEKWKVMKSSKCEHYKMYDLGIGKVT